MAISAPSLFLLSAFTILVQTPGGYFLYALF